MQMSQNCEAHGKRLESRIMIMRDEGCLPLTENAVMRFLHLAIVSQNCWFTLITVFSQTLNTLMVIYLQCG